MPMGIMTNLQKIVYKDVAIKNGYLEDLDGNITNVQIFNSFFNNDNLIKLSYQTIYNKSGLVQTESSYINKSQTSNGVDYPNIEYDVTDAYHINNPVYQDGSDILEFQDILNYGWGFILSIKDDTNINGIKPNGFYYENVTEFPYQEDLSPNYSFLWGQQLNSDIWEFLSYINTHYDPDEERKIGKTFSSDKIFSKFKVFLSSSSNTARPAPTRITNFWINGNCYSN